MDTKQAIETLSLRGDQVAQSLGVEEGPGWRDNVGTAHLYIRGALQSLERIANSAHSLEDAGAAMGTVAFANKSPDGFLGEHTSEAAKIARKILQTELFGGSVADAVTVEDLNLLSQDLQSFSNDVLGQSRHPDADESLKAFSGVLQIANNHYQAFTQQLKSDLSSSGPTSGPSDPKPPAP